MVKILIQLNNSNPWVVIATFYVLITLLLPIPSRFLRTPSPQFPLSEVIDMIKLNTHELLNGASRFRGVLPDKTF